MGYIANIYIGRAIAVVCFFAEIKETVENGSKGRIPNAEIFRPSGTLTQENPGVDYLVFIWDKSLAQKIMRDGNFLLGLYKDKMGFMYYKEVFIH